MKLKLDITPDLVAAMAAEVKAGEKAVTAAMREAGTGLKTAWRGQITGAGLGRRLANSIRSQTFPKAGESLNAAALVWSKAPVIVGAHDTGPLIRSKDGFWLAIPTPAAGRGLRGGRITPGEWERRRGLRLRFVYRRRGPSLLVAEGRLNSRGLGVASRSKTGRGRTTVPIFLLVPQVKLPKRLNLDRDAERALDSPYNTYHPSTAGKLTPGPISSPERSALEAALAPAEGDWLFFVTVDLDTGETKFTNTLDEHNAAVAELRAWCAASPENQKKCTG